MSGFLDFASLLGGISSEAAQVRTERHQQENDAFNQTQQILNGLLSQPGLTDEARQQAVSAALDLSMEHMGYSKKSKSNNPVRKAVEGLVGQSVPDYSKALGGIGQPGVGTGNAKTALGGLPPASPTGQPPMQLDGASGALQAQGMAIPTPPPAVALDSSGRVPLFNNPTQIKQQSASADFAGKKQEWDDINTIPAIQEMKEKDPRGYNDLLVHHFAGFTIPGSTNSRVNPAGSAVSVDQALKLHANEPELVAQLNQFKDAGVTHVVNLTDSRDNSITGFSPAKDPTPVAQTLTITGVKDPSSPTGYSTQVVDKRDPRKVLQSFSTSPAETTAERDAWIKAHPGKDAADFLAYKASLAPNIVYQLNNPNGEQDQVSFFADQVDQDPANWNLVSGNKALANQVRKELSTRGEDVHRLTASTRQLGETSHGIIPKIESTITTLNDPKIAAKLGPILGRYNDFMAGEVGAGDPDIAALRTTMGLIQTGAMRAHVGARGSAALIDKFEDLFNTKKMDATTLKATLGSLRDFLNGYDQQVYGADAVHPKTLTAAPGTAPAGAKATHRYNPATGTVEPIK